MFPLDFTLSLFYLFKLIIISSERGLKYAALTWECEECEVNPQIYEWNVVFIQYLPCSDDK